MWPPDYIKEFRKRGRILKELYSDKKKIAGAYHYYKNNPAIFICDWGMTYDPRNASKGLPTKVPFILFEKQKELVEFLLFCVKNQFCGLNEKSRDMGVTWVCVGFSVWIWIFYGGASVGWGSRKEMYVDRIGDPDSIFEKIRFFIDNLPSFFLPYGFNKLKHMGYMKIINPENGATITGEAGDNIGRGGRKLIYFKDESAHYERPEKVEAALGDNTNTQIDISSVNGSTNIFARKRKNGVIWKKGEKYEKGTQLVIIADWKDHPGKDQKWYDARKEKAEREGLLDLFLQEVDRDYTSAIEGLLIPAKYVKAAIDAHLKLNINITGERISSLDVADEGKDKNSWGYRHGILTHQIKNWVYGDTGQTATRAVANSLRVKATSLQYDCIGVGSGVKAETNRLVREKILDENKLAIIAWNAASSPKNKNGRLIPGDEESPLNKDFFENLNSQAWWQLRLRFERTYFAVKNNIVKDPSELISLSSKIEDLNQLEAELSQPTYTRNGSGKIVVDKKPPGTRSPNMADNVKMLYWPLEKKRVFI